MGIAMQSGVTMAMTAITKRRKKPSPTEHIEDGGQTLNGQLFLLFDLDLHHSHHKNFAAARNSFSAPLYLLPALIQLDLSLALRFECSHFPPLCERRSLAAVGC